MSDEEQLDTPRAPAVDYPHFRVVPDNDERLAARLAAMPPQERAAYLERVQASRATDQGAVSARQATLRLAETMGWAPDAERTLAELAACPSYAGLAWAGLRYPLEPGPHLLRGPLLLTRRPELARTSGPVGPRGRPSTVGRLLAIACVSARDLGRIAPRPAEQPVAVPPGHTLRILGTRELAGADVVLAVEAPPAPPSESPVGSEVPAEAWWIRVQRSLTAADAADPTDASSPADADPRPYLTGSLP